MTQSPEMIFLKDYTPPAYFVETVDLEFFLAEEKTIVVSTMQINKNNKVTEDRSLELYGKNLVLTSITVDGKCLSEDDYEIDGELLSLHCLTAGSQVIIKTEIFPQKNTSLEGLYKSSGNFCTQCEAEGFRAITYFPDRPDVMAKFTTKITGDKQKYPIMLSNGNLVGRGDLEEGQHWVKWEDPFKKPSYLFALVAGNLQAIKDQFITCSGRVVDLEIYVEQENIDKCDHAMQSLKRSMKWDEEKYGREYDLDIYMIVAVNDFNMGAMENKGLNIFNSKYILAKPETATDSDFIGIEAVVAHEYFHNWTGNRITLRDWFQLSLKEGLTVFRDQEFTSDMNSRADKRISDVRVLRSSQFLEDGGPMAHPVRPQSFVEINNFYTSTIYNKGAEVIRMFHTLLGPQDYRKATDLFFERFDGQAVTTEDFLQCMIDASGQNLEQFQTWYDQAGTPEVEVLQEYDENKKSLRLTLKQSCPETPGQKNKKPFLIPFRMGLINKAGEDMILSLDSKHPDNGKTTMILRLDQEENVFDFQGIDEKPFLSLLRNFSAPIKIKYNRSNAELAFLMAHDSDEFNRWEASEVFSLKVLKDLIKDVQSNKKLEIDEDYLNSFEKLLLNKKLSDSLKAHALTLPSEAYVGESLETIDVDAIYQAREFLLNELSRIFNKTFLDLYKECDKKEEYNLSPESVGRRSLKNLALSYIGRSTNADDLSLILNQYYNADNMTEVIFSLNVVSNIDTLENSKALEDFYNKWKHDPLVINKWHSIQSMSKLPGTLGRVKKLMNHEAFDIKNPNSVRSLIGAFCANNLYQFHDKSGNAYKFLADQVIELNTVNPQIAANLITPLIRWKRYDSDRQLLLKQELERIKKTPNLSTDVYEKISKSLN